MRKFWFIKIPVMILLFMALISWVVMLLWNWLMPDLFTLPEITFWQAAGLFLLSKILFGLGGKGGPGRHGPPWRKHFQEKWKSMPEDQREKWKRRFTDKWCGVEEPEKKEEEKVG